MVTVKTPGRVEFQFLAPHVDRVQVVGEFTDWMRQPIEMAPSADGWWRVTTPVPFGEHRFRYLVDGSRWVTDFAAFGVAPNEFGQFDSMLVVEADSRQSLQQPIAAS